MSLKNEVQKDINEGIKHATNRCVERWVLDRSAGISPDTTVQDILDACDRLERRIKSIRLEYKS